MKVENLKDIIHWTRQSHQSLANCMKHCANETKNSRAKLLLNYLAEHEEILNTTLDKVNTNENKGALDTWFIEYLDKNPIDLNLDSDKPVAQMGIDEIMRIISVHHQQIIELYKGLIRQADIPEVKALLEQLVSLEEHEVMRMVQSANRLEDL